MDFIDGDVMMNGFHYNAIIQDGDPHFYYKFLTFIAPFSKVEKSEIKIYHKISW
jgi:hypothetical protein